MLRDLKHGSEFMWNNSVVVSESEFFLRFFLSFFDFLEFFSSFVSVSRVFKNTNSSMIRSAFRTGIGRIDSTCFKQNLKGDFNWWVDIKIFGVICCWLILYWRYEWICEDHGAKWSNICKFWRVLEARERLPRWFELESFWFQWKYNK
jgi:hypothetical protein